MTTHGGDHISGTIRGNVSGQVAVGKGITQRQQIGSREELTDAELAELKDLFRLLESRVAAEAPDVQRAPALERVTELEEALTTGEPDLGTVRYVKRWFLKKLPSVAGLITGVLVNPIVGKLVQAGGDVAVFELARVIEE